MTLPAGDEQERQRDRSARIVLVNPTRVEGGRSSSLGQVLNALRLVPGLDVSESANIPAQSIAVGGKVVAFIDDLDAWQSASPSQEGESVDAIQKLSPRLIFKYQYRSEIDYLPGTVSAGYFCPYELIAPPPRDLLERPRPLDVSVRMRSDGYGPIGRASDWSKARCTIVEAALQLGREGWRVVTGKIDRDEYYDELFNTNLGFNWRGYGKLTYRMVEYARAGVVMITDPLGPSWPIREDVALEDGVHCIFCDDPARFADVARSLLRDPRKLDAIRRNLIDLWESKLCPAAMGAWYWSKLNGDRGDGPSS